MPSIPVYNTATVQPDALPAVRQSTPASVRQMADVVGSQATGMGQALVAAGTAGMQYLTQEQIHQNEARSKEYDANLMGGIQAVLYGSADSPESGFLNSKGKAAVDTHEAAIKKLQQLPVDQGGTLDNDAQKRLVQSTTQLRIQAAIAEANRHVAQQSNIYQESAGQVRLTVAQQGAAKYFRPGEDAPLLQNPRQPAAPAAEGDTFAVQPAGQTDFDRRETIDGKEYFIGQMANGSPYYVISGNTVSKERYESQRANALKRDPNPKTSQSEPTSGTGTGAVARAVPTPQVDEESNYSLALKTIRAEATEQANRKGLTDPDLRTAFVKEAMSKTYVGVLAHLLDGKQTSASQMKVAQQYYDSVKDELAPEQQDKIHAVLKAGAERDASLNLYYEVQNLHLPLEQQVGAVDARYQAGLITSAERDATVTRLEHAYSMSETVKAKARVDAKEGEGSTALALALETSGKVGSDILAQTKYVNQLFTDGVISADVRNMTVQQLDHANTQRRVEQTESDRALVGRAWELARGGKAITALAPAEMAYVKQRGLGPQIDAIFKRDKAGVDDSKMYSDLARMSAENPAAFLRMDLSTVSGQLSEGHWNHLIGIQTSINRQDVQAMELNKVVHNTITSARSSLSSAGINTSPKAGSSDAKRLETFETDLRDALAAAQPAWAAKKLSPAQIAEESRNIMLGHLKEQALNGTGYFNTTIGQTKKRVFEMSPAERAAVWTIPDTERAQIRASLQNNGMPVDEATIQRVYKASQGVY